MDSTFFGLTSDYKQNLWDEIYLCRENLGFTYQDIMSMPVNERRYYLGLHVKRHLQQQEQSDNSRRNQKGKKTISGDALISKINSGEIN